MMYVKRVEFNNVVHSMKTPAYRSPPYVIDCWWRLKLVFPHFACWWNRSVRRSTLRKVMSTPSVHSSGNYSLDEASFDILSWPSSQKCLQCPLYEAPRCFKTVLTRALELGEGNFIPTNWRGFSDYFRLEELKARSAEELVDAWANKHPFRDEHTLLKVVEYARSTRHVKLLQIFKETLKDHLLPEHMWTNDAAQCFKPCHSCVPLPQPDLKFSDDMHIRRNPLSNQDRTHRRSHSLPKNIQILPRCQCNSRTCNTASSVTNIYHMSCCCSNSPFTPTIASPSTQCSCHHRLPTHSSDTEDHHTRSNSMQISDSEGETFIPSDSNPQTPEDLYEPCKAQPRNRFTSYPCYSTTPTHPHTRKSLPYIRSSSSEIPKRATNVKIPSNLQLCQVHPDASPAVSTGLNLAEIREQEGVKSQDVGGTGGVDEGAKRVDVMQRFGQQLFDTPPYNLVQRFYNSKSREWIILTLAFFFLYNGLRCILQSMCEDGGFHKIFTSADTTLVETTQRVAMLSLRILSGVISPLCLCVHVSAIAAKPRIPETSLSEAAAIKRMLCVHRTFSPHYEVRFIQPQSVFQMSEIMTKRHINSIWMSILNSIFFSAVIVYTGGFKIAMQGVTDDGVCEFLSLSEIHMPLLNRNIDILLVLDLLLTLGVLILVYTIKEYYYYENRIAIFAITVGGEAEKLYKEIRRRWVLLDLFCYFTAGTILIASFAFAAVKRTILPDPLSPLKPEDLLNWCFWLSGLGVVSFLGNSSSRLVKKTSFPAYILVVILSNVVNLRIDAVPHETFVIFIHLCLCNLVINLMLSLFNCHFNHWRISHSRTSLFFLLLSLSLLLLLPLSIAITLSREVVHLAAFVEW